MYTNINGTHIKEQIHKCVTLFSTVTCETISSPTNGGKTYDMNGVNGKYPVYTVVTFTCNSGYTLSGYNTRTCETSGNWNKQSPTCKKSKENEKLLWFR